MAPIPGAYDGDTRFMRMAILKSVALLQQNAPPLRSCWPDAPVNDISPAATAGKPSYPKANGAIKAALAILDTVALPRGKHACS